MRQGCGSRARDFASVPEHLDRHIVPLIGAVKLAEFTAPMLASFEQRLKK